MFNRRPREVPFSDLIDLLLDSDEEARKLVLFEALQSGTIKKSEAEHVIAQVERLERAAAPWHRPQSVQQPAVAAAPDVAAAFVSVAGPVAVASPPDKGEPVEHVGQAA